jgi:FkbM family methyltransferase
MQLSHLLQQRLQQEPLMTKPPAHFRDVLTPTSKARYTLWRLLGGKRPIDLDLASGLRLRMRSLTTTDYDVAWQMFWRGDYDSPKPLHDVRNIVDLGANVGYSCLYWCQTYPLSQVTAFEPHPVHLDATKENLTRNGFLDRVKVVGAAAGTSEKHSYLTDGRSSSAVTDQPAAFQIRVLDIFGEQELLNKIDILKIDIEGGEYEILSDPRFAQLNVGAMVVEWHNSPEHPDGRAWCLDKLQSLGYETHIGAEDLPLAGLVWAFR